MNEGVLRENLSEARTAQHRRKIIILEIAHDIAIVRADFRHVEEIWHNAHKRHENSSLLPEKWVRHVIAGCEYLHLLHVRKGVRVVDGNPLPVGDTVFVTGRHNPEYILLCRVNGKQILKPVIRRNGIVREIDDVFPLDNVTGNPPAEVVIYVVLQVDLLLMRKAVKIRLRLVRRAVVDRDELNVPTRKIRMSKQAIDRTARKLHLVVSRYNDRDTVLEICAARTLTRCLKRRQCLSKMFLLPLRMAQDIVFEIELDAQIENKRAHFVGKKLPCLFRCMRRECFICRMRGIQCIATTFLDECPFLA